MEGFTLAGAGWNMTTALSRLIVKPKALHNRQPVHETLYISSSVWDQVAVIDVEIMDKG